MHLLLLTDIPGHGKKHQVVDVADAVALDELLPQRKALVATETVRRRYAGVISVSSSL
jgi:ribosomal protein L9